MEERTLSEALEHAPVVRRAPRAAERDLTAADAATQVLDPLEREALALLLRYPGLAAELDEDPLPFREAIAVQLGALAS